MTLAHVSGRVILFLALAWPLTLLGLLTVGVMWLSGAFDRHGNGSMIGVSLGGLILLAVIIVGPPVLLGVLWRAARRAELRHPAA
jgi:hypothetical protein